MDAATRDRARRFIESQHWTFAKTVPETPHWYVMAHLTSDPDEFRWFMDLIASDGYDEEWSIPGVRPRTYRYLTIDGFDYWYVHSRVTKPSLNRRVHV